MEAILTKLNKLGYTFNKWSISKEMYNEFLNIIKELNFPISMFEEFLEDNFYEKYDIDFNREIPLYNKNNIKQNEYYLYWNYFEYDGKEYRHCGILVEEKSMISKLVKRFGRYVYISGKFYYNGYLLLNNEPMFENVWYKMFEQTESMDMIKWSPENNYISRNENYPENDDKNGIIPIYKDIAKNSIRKLRLRSKEWQVLNCL